MSMLHQLHRTSSAFVRDDRGQDLVEYGLLACLIATVAIVAMSQVGLTILNTFWAVIAASIPKV